MILWSSKRSKRLCVQTPSGQSAPKPGLAKLIVITEGDVELRRLTIRLTLARAHLQRRLRGCRINTRIYYTQVRVRVFARMSVRV